VRLFAKSPCGSDVPGGLSLSDTGERGSRGLAPNARPELCKWDIGVVCDKGMGRDRFELPYFGTGRMASPCLYLFSAQSFHTVTAG